MLDGLRLNDKKTEAFWIGSSTGNEEIGICLQQLRLLTSDTAKRRRKSELHSINSFPLWLLRERMLPETVLLKRGAKGFFAIRVFNSLSGLQQAKRQTDNGIT